jgi:hypothetical protein
VAKWASLALIVVLAVLAALALRPGPQRAEVRDEIRLENAQVRLFPASDADAVWRFAAPEVSYDPGARETTLLRIEDGERRVADGVDFTLAAERLVIGRDDDLRSERMDVHLVEDDLDVEMEGAGDRQVRVDQDEGRFEVPRIRIFGEDFGESRYQDMRVSFDFTDFQAGGPDTVGYSEFELDERGDAASGGTP